MGKTKISAGQMGVFVALMCMYFLAPTHSNVNVVSMDIMNLYGVGATDISYMISITQLLEIPAAFVMGLIAGRFLSYRWCALIATFLTALGGLPAILGASMSWEVLMATRCLLGLGLGCYMPIVLGCISVIFQKDDVRAAMMGVASVIFNIGMILTSSMCGVLGLISWNLAWTVHLLALIPFVLVIFLVNPKNVPVIPTTDEKGEKVKIKLPVVGWLFLVVFLGGIIMSQSLFNLGGVSIAAVVDNPAVIGTIFSCFSVGAIGSAVLFPIGYKFLKATTLPVFWIVGLCGYVLWYFAHTTGSIPLFYAAIILAGFGTNAFTVGVPLMLSTMVAPAIAAAVMGFSYVFQNGGGFMASPIDAFVSNIFGADAIMSSVWLFNIILGIIMVVALFAIAKKTNAMLKAQEAAAAE